MSKGPRKEKGQLLRSCPFSCSKPYPNALFEAAEHEGIVDDAHAAVGGLKAHALNDADDAALDGVVVHRRTRHGSASHGTVETDGPLSRNLTAQARVRLQLALKAVTNRVGASRHDAADVRRVAEVTDLRGTRRQLRLDLTGLRL